MDALNFLIQFQDYLAPRLDTYEQAIYLYIVRHSRLIGQDEVVIGFRSASKALAMGSGKLGRPMSDRSCYEKLRALCEKGFVQNLGTTHRGTKVKAFLPEEIHGLISIPNVDPAINIEDIDFFTNPEYKALLLVREANLCFYCLQALDENNFVAEHVVSRPKGSNSYRNLVAACRQCNNRKSSVSAEDFLRTLYRERLLSTDEFENRISHLERLRNGDLKPDISSIQPEQKRAATS